MDNSLILHRKLSRSSIGDSKHTAFHAVFYNASLIAYAFPLFALTACFTSNANLVTTQAATATAISLPSTARAAQFIFTTNTTGGSFNSPTSGGTTLGVGNGLQAVRVFNADGSLLANGTTATTWPSWITSFEIGISGSNNTAAPNQNCATFAGANENTNTNCLFPGAGATVSCGAYPGTFRVSEVDCGVNPPTVGTGTDQDGIYFRATFNRNTSYLGATENVMAVVNYSAAAYNPAPANPTSCFTNGKFTPESCSDFTWKVFLKHTPSEVVQPYVMMIPPTAYYVNGSTSGTSSSTPMTKQFFLPLAGDPNLTSVQFSRINSTLNSANGASGGYITACDNGGTRLSATGANTPLCAGIVIYSITFFRI